MVNKTKTRHLGCNANYSYLLGTPLCNLWPIPWSSSFKLQVQLLLLTWLDYRITDIQSARFQLAQWGERPLYEFSSHNTKLPCWMQMVSENNRTSNTSILSLLVRQTHGFKSCRRNTTPLNWKDTRASTKLEARV